MVNTYKVFYLILGLAIVGCRKDDATEAVIRMQLLYNGEPMITQQEYDYPDGKTFVLTKFSTYLSNITLQSGNETRLVEEVRLINLTETLRNSASSLEGFTIFKGETGLNSIDQMRFNIGLTPEQNRKLPADYPSGHPLALPGEHWLAWSSYIFVKIEGWIDLDDDGMAETGVALHLGADQVMKSIRLFIPPGAMDLTIQIDLARIFAQNTIYDIRTNPQIHSLSQIEALIELSNNLEKAVTIKAPL